MQMSLVKNSGERKKLAIAVVLGLIALIFLWWTFFGFGSTNVTNSRGTAVPTPSPKYPIATAQGNQRPVEAVKDDLRTQLRPVVYPTSTFSAPEAKRNIFAYYEPPPPAAKTAETPTPTPTPTPPVLLAAVAPANVYARTSDFVLEVTGDKFTSELRAVMDGRELPTRYMGPQQISANVSAAMIANPGSKQIILRSPDGRLYSNAIMLAVTAPPTPNYTYVGIIGTPRHLDTAIVQDKGSKEVLNVQRGDILGGRFRITSISEKELVLIDTNLKIRHALAFTTSESDKGFNPLQRPTPKVDSEDDEP